ncbi:MAG: sensor histidine kinase N-terminal domain-containing protein, partial [Burkholderiales bacterium]|nr:sensor histidine kinase N-terminal domain-containing protein [Burkholderiales bacterium]
MAERQRGSLLRVLLGVLLPALALLLGAEWWASWRSAVDAANAAYDRSLLGAAKAVDANLSTASGGLGVELPYRMFEFFALTASGRVYFRVGTEDGLVAIGNTDLPPPPRPAVTGRPQFSDAEYFGEPVRIASYARVLDPPLAGQGPGQRVLIQVAETLESRRAFTWALMRQALARDILLALAAAALLWLAVRWALRPLDRLRREVQARAAGDLGPLAPRGLPADVLPLVEALNHHVERHREEAQARRRF